MSALPADARLGAVDLTVTDLDRAIAFYTDTVGLRVHRREGDEVAVLGDGQEDVLVLHADAAASQPGRTAGLYHVALLYPSRLELARAALRLAADRTPIQGASDHGTHEAIYLPDPDGNGLELAADRPREEWISFEDEFARGGPAPLDTADLLGLVEDEPPAPRTVEGLRTGHVHLHVSDLDAATRFYRDVVGFDVRFAIPSAVFVSVGGYHHHVAFNTWRGTGVPPAPADAVGLRHFSVLLADDDALAGVRDRAQAAGVTPEQDNGTLVLRDPAGNRVAFAAQPA